MLTEDQKAEICQEVATCPTYLEKLDQYERQALQQYVKGKQQYLASRPEAEQTYYRAAFPAYELADVVAALLATPAAEADPAATVPPGGLTLRQTAMLCYYSEQPLTENNAATIAAREGLKSPTSGKQLVGKYTEFCELQQGKLPTDLKALSHLEKALTGLLPRLEGEALHNANAYLKQVSKKKQRGF